MRTESDNESTLAVWAFDHAMNYSACQYYRIDVPMRSLADSGLETYIDRGTGDREIALQSMLNTDIMQTYAMTGDSMPGLFETIRDMEPAKGPVDGKILVPPSIVYDIDDNLDYIHPFNAAYAHMGTRDGDGNLLEPGDNITTIMPNGEEFLVWDDLKTRGEDNILFNVARNRRTVSSAFALAKMAHGVTTPSPILSDYFTKVHGVKNVYTYPNTVVPADYTYYNLVPRTDDSVRILWQGGASHMVDWFPLRDALREVAEKYPQAKFVIWGQKFPWIHDVIPDAQIEYHGWVHYHAYKFKRTLLDIDINIAPLAGTLFNKCKSAIKWYEASLGPNPEVTLAANVPPYGLEMVDGETGMLYSTPAEFVQKMGTLIEDATLRKTLAQNAQKWVLANRTPEVTTPGLIEFYKELRRQREYPYHAKLIMA